MVKYNFKLESKDFDIRIESSDYLKTLGFFPSDSKRSSANILFMFKDAEKFHDLQDSLWSYSVFNDINSDKARYSTGSTTIYELDTDTDILLIDDFQKLLQLTSRHDSDEPETNLKNCFFHVNSDLSPVFKDAGISMHGLEEYLKNFDFSALHAYYDMYEGKEMREMENTGNFKLETQLSESIFSDYSLEVKLNVDDEFNFGEESEYFSSICFDFIVKRPTLPDISMKEFEYFSEDKDIVMLEEPANDMFTYASYYHDGTNIRVRLPRDYDFSGEANSMIFSFKKSYSHGCDLREEIGRIAGHAREFSEFFSDSYGADKEELEKKLSSLDDIEFSTEYSFPVYDE